MKTLILALMLVLLPGCETVNSVIDWTSGLVVSDEDGKVIVGRKCVENPDKSVDCTTTLPDGKTIKKHYKAGEVIPSI